MQSKKTFLILIILFIIMFFNIIDMSYAATVGNPLDLDLPPRSSMLRQEIIEETLDEYEQAVKIKAAVDLEFVFDKDLDTTWELRGAEMEGQWYMAKVGLTLFNRIEPYIKMGTSSLEVKWKQQPDVALDVEAADDFAWGCGIKGIIWEMENWGIRLTGDAQYRTTNPDVDKISRSGTKITDTGADFEVKEWQAALVLSKKFELPLKWQSVYLVPYTGITASGSTVDVSFIDPNSTADYSLFDASNDKTQGFLLGCDIMPSLSSAFAYNVEVRLVSETALTLGGAVKF